MKLRTTTAFAALVLATGTAGAQQTLTFTNTDTDAVTPGNQNQVITLLGGSTVSIATNGNVSAQCALSGSLCTGTGTGGGPVTVSLAASGFSNGQTASPFTVGTTFTLTPTVSSNGQVCVRSVTRTPNATSNTNWPATVLPPFTAATVTMSDPLTTYQFTMKCYGDGGSTTFTLPNLVTGPGLPPTSCSGFQVPLPSGWSRTPPTTMPEVLTIQGFPWNNFPNGGGRGVIVTAPTQYISIRIRTPADVTAWSNAAPQKRLFVDASQTGGPADLAKIYMSISECAGDFRIPPANGSAPTTDRTFARGCRSYRPFSVGGASGPRDDVQYQIGTGPSSETTCQLAPDTEYHINFIRADVADNAIGSPTEEATCNSAVVTTCGVDMEVN